MSPENGPVNLFQKNILLKFTLQTVMDYRFPVLIKTNNNNNKKILFNGAWVLIFDLCSDVYFSRFAFLLAYTVFMKEVFLKRFLMTLH